MYSSPPSLEGEEKKKKDAGGVSDDDAAHRAVVVGRVGAGGERRRQKSLRIGVHHANGAYGNQCIERTLFNTVMISRSFSSARYTFATVCASTPWLASTTSSAPSHAASDRDTS